MPTIENLLHRRTDLSTFLVHLTRSGGGKTAADNLESILTNLLVEARTPMGPAAHLEEHLAGSPASQKVVCFTETPLEHVWMMLEDIEGRAIHFEPYGLAITKTTGRKAGFNPVWYSDITRRGVDWPATAVNDLVSSAVGRATAGDGLIDTIALSADPIFQLTPYFEQMGPTNASRKEFWWEREWRKVGDYNLSFPSRVVGVLAPEDDHVRVERVLVNLNARWAKRPILDPRWGLERMIATLARVPDEEVGPFPEAR